MATTEDPQDAQEQTVHTLGLDTYIDLLATTSHFRALKIDGLFPQVLGHLNISPGNIAYVGHNYQREIKPAMAGGIFAIHLTETKHVSLANSPVRVNTLQKLQYILADGHID